VTSGGNNFNDFPENKLLKFQQIGMAAAIPAIPLPLPAPLSTDKLEQRVKFLKTIIRQVEKNTTI